MAEDVEAPGPTDKTVAILAEEEGFLDLTVGQLRQVNENGYSLLQKDYRVGGEVWRVHKGDADPFTSRPHAHCVGGAERFQGLKLHLGTSELYRGPRPMGLRMDPKQFDRLCVLIRPKFPGLILPLPVNQGASG